MRAGARKPDWSSLGLTGNPFENVAPGEALSWVDVAPEVAEALRTRPFCVELVGEKGAGKTTTLRWYAAQHEDARYGYVSGAELPREAAAVWCLDEVNNAPPSAVRELVAQAQRRGMSLLLSSHVAHLEPGLRQIELSRCHALGWVHRRVAAAALPGATAFDFPAVAASVFPSRTVVNYALLRVLYELAENLARGAAVPEALDDAIRRAREDETVAPLLR